MLCLLFPFLGRREKKKFGNTSAQQNGSEKGRKTVLMKSQVQHFGCLERSPTTDLTLESLDALCGFSLGVPSPSRTDDFLRKFGGQKYS